MAKVLSGHVVTNAASDERNDRGIAGVSEHRDEVENHIDRRARYANRKPTRTRTPTEVAG
jgi:uncharacterized protein YlxP (DUF503 family)